MKKFLASSDDHSVKPKSFYVTVSSKWCATHIRHFSWRHDIEIFKPCAICFNYGTVHKLVLTTDLDALEKVTIFNRCLESNHGPSRCLRAILAKLSRVPSVIKIWDTDLTKYETIIVVKTETRSFSSEWPTRFSSRNNYLKKARINQQWITVRKNLSPQSEW